jgi:hypothetical protein
MTSHNVSFSIDCSSIWFRHNWFCRDNCKFIWLIREWKIVFQNSMSLYRFSVAKSDLICIQMSSLSVSINVFDDEFVETDQIDKKTRSKKDVQQLNVDWIIWFFDNDVNNFILLNRINRFVDSQSIFEINQVFYLNSW